MSWILALTVGGLTWAARWHDTGDEAADLEETDPALVDLAKTDPSVEGDSAEGGGVRPMPSAVWTDGTTTLVAEEALERGKSAPDDLIADPSSLLGAAPVRRDDKRVEPVDLVAAVLTEAYARATAAVGSEPDEILVTHPDSWSGDQVSALRQAAYRAKLRIDPVVEGVAAASAYAAWGGPGTRVLVMDADRRSAAVVAKVNRVFVVLTSARDMGNRPLRPLADEVLARPGVHREQLNDVILLRTDPDESLINSLTDFTGRAPSELTSEAVVLGALYYHRALNPVAPEPVVERPPPLPPPPPSPRVNHYAPVKRKVAVVPLLILILVVLVILELLFVYWPF